MSIIRNIVNKINPTKGGGAGEAEVVTFDDEGHIVRRSLLDKLFLVALIGLVALLSFGIGRLSVVNDREGIQILYENLDTTQETSDQLQTSSKQPAAAINAAGQGSVVVSKSGSKYHFLHCSGAKQIKEENKVTYTSPSAAETAGYTLAANCKVR